MVILPLSEVMRTCAEHSPLQINAAGIHRSKQHSQSKPHNQKNEADK